MSVPMPRLKAAAPVSSTFHSNQNKVDSPDRGLPVVPI